MIDGNQGFVPVVTARVASGFSPFEDIGAKDVRAGEVDFHEMLFFEFSLCEFFTTLDNKSTNVGNSRSRSA
jgi:hypothetical protein